MRRGKTWKVWSHAVTSSRQRVDRCPTIINSVLCRTVLSAANDEQYWHCHANPPVVGLIIEARESKFFTKLKHHPHVSTLCLPYKIAHDQISQAFPIPLLSPAIQQASKCSLCTWACLPANIYGENNFLHTSTVPPSNSLLSVAMHIHFDHCRYYPGRCLKLNMQYPLG